MSTPILIKPFKKYSQFNEDGIIESIFSRIKENDKFFVEIGCGPNGIECNTRFLKERGWKGIQIDLLSRDPDVLRHRIGKDNVNSILAQNNVPTMFDLFSLDIDSNDYWVLKSFLSQYRPRVVVCEYNCYFGPDKSVTLKYNPNQKWDGVSWTYGASLAAFDKILTSCEYKLVSTSAGVNAFWVNNTDILKYDILVPTKADVFTTLVRNRKFVDGCWVNV